MIKNCPVTEEDITVAEKVFGKDTLTLKGKLVRMKPIPKVHDYIKIPKEIMKKHCDIELCVDIMYIQGLTFMTTICCNINSAMYKCPLFWM